MVRTAIQVLALGLTLVSTYHLVRAGLGLSPEVIAGAANPPWDKVEQVANSLAAQRANTVVGFSAFLAAIALQTWSVLWPVRWSDFSTDYLGIAIGVIASITLAIGAHYLSNHIETATLSKVMEVLEQRRQ